MRPAVSIIANPAAGYRQRAWRAPVERILSALGTVDVITPGSAEATTAAARACESRGVSLIDAARSMLDGARRDIDAIRVNGRRVVTVAVFGAVAESVSLAHRLRLRAPWIGAHAYRLAAAQMIVTRGREPVAGVFASNLPRLGGNMRLPSRSVPDDGVCEVATLQGGSRVRLARALLALSLGRSLPAGALDWTPVRETTLVFDEATEASGDGEHLGSAHAFEIVVEPRAIRIVGGTAGG